MQTTLRQEGFSLVEVLVATGVFLLTIALGAQVLRLANSDSQTTQNLNEVQQNARIAMKFLERDITNAGESLLQGNAGDASLGVQWPLVSRDAFLNMRGGRSTQVATLDDLTNQATQSQEFPSLLPVARKDNLGNGSTVDNGSSDRLTISYRDEFIGALERDYSDSAATKQIGTTRVVEYTGIMDFANRRLTLDNVDNNILANTDGTFTKRTNRNDELKPGDLLLVTGKGATNSDISALVMVTGFGSGFGVNTHTDVRRIDVAEEVVGFNKMRTNITNKPFPRQRDRFPLDRLSIDDKGTIDDGVSTNGDEEGDDTALTTLTVKAIKVNVYSYFVDSTTRSLVRRRYGLVANTGMVGNSFIDDSVCQNIERLRFSFNLLVPPTTDPTPTPAKLANLVDIDPDKTNITMSQMEYERLRFIRLVNVSLALRSSEVDRRNKVPSRYALVSSFSPRNIAYNVNRSN
jgi:type II secretory pathway pseudopilin PulG